MLKDTFHHMPGIDMKSEKKLRDTGVVGWEDVGNLIVK